jgi:hypothetical protein
MESTDLSASLTLLCHLPVIGLSWKSGADSSGLYFFWTDSAQSPWVGTQVSASPIHQCEINADYLISRPDFR